MRTTDLHVPEPCDADWSALPGDDRVRYCDRCQKSVTNLSALTEEEAIETLARDSSRCVRYLVDGDRVRFRAGGLAVGLLVGLALPAVASILPMPDTSVPSGALPVVDTGLDLHPERTVTPDPREAGILGGPIVSTGLRRLFEGLE